MLGTRGIDPDALRDRVQAGCGGYADEIRAFMEATFVQDGEARVTKWDVYHTYLSWCQDHGYWKATKPCFRQHVKGMGFSEHMAGGVAYWSGMDWRRGPQ